LRMRVHHGQLFGLYGCDETGPRVDLFVTAKRILCLQRAGHTADPSMPETLAPLLPLEAAVHRRLQADVLDRL
jgi:hypothetical protein